MIGRWKHQWMGKRPAWLVGWLTLKNRLRDCLPGRSRQKVLYAFNDFQTTSPTYDIVTFLLLAESRRLELGCDSMTVVFIPGHRDGFRVTDGKEQNEMGNENLRWRLRQIVVPCCSLMPSCTAMLHFDDRKTARRQLGIPRYRYPEAYDYAFPLKSNYWVDVERRHQSTGTTPSIEATPVAVNYVRQWMQRNGFKKVVTMSLRDASYMAGRNSNRDEWLKMARYLEQAGTTPVILPDNEVAFDPGDELRPYFLFNEALWNVELRAALYQESYMNLFVSGGPVALSMCNWRSRSLIFKISNEEFVVTSKKHIRESMGLESGESPCVCGLFQQYVWKEDTFENIRTAYDQMVEKIEAAG